MLTFMDIIWFYDAWRVLCALVGDNSRDYVTLPAHRTTRKLVNYAYPCRQLHKARSATSTTDNEAGNPDTNAADLETSQTDGIVDIDLPNCLTS